MIVTAPRTMSATITVPAFKMPLSAFQMILSHIEPMYKLKPGELADAEMDDMAKQLDNLTDEELLVLEKIGIRR